MLNSQFAGQRFFVPEVVQTSAMDCGPAALKSIMEGFGISVSYGRLREACQTDVDGTSINTLEDIAVQLGLQAEQVMLPADHLILPEAQALPAIVVVRLPNGFTHFLVVWSRVGNFLQIMDPASGRRWLTWNNFQKELFIHTFPVATEDWRLWAGTEGLLAPLRRRMLELKIEEKTVERLIQSALQDSGWRSLATLDAATRMTAAVVHAKGLTPGEQASGVLERFFRMSLEGALPGTESIPSIETIPTGKFHIPVSYWSVIPIIDTPEEASGSAPPRRLFLQGAVLVRILGKREITGIKIEEETPVVQFARLPPDLEAALTEPSYKPEREVWKALKEDGLLTPAVLSVALFLATFGVFLEALLFQGMLQIGQQFTLLSQRILAVLAVFAFILAPFFLELPISATVARMGRRLEARLRIAFLEKIPRLGDRYFRSRLASDMTQRAHDLRSLRLLPSLGVNLLRTTFQLILTMLGVIWLDAYSAPYAIIGTGFFIALSFLTSPLLEERDLRLRTHTGALSRFYLDALLGLIPVKTHGSERSLRRQHEIQLFEWIGSGRQSYWIGSAIQSFGALFYSLFSILIMINYISRGGESNEILLLFYWTLSLPALGQALADMIQQYPMQRNRVLRLLEPLGAPDEEEAWSSGKTAAPSVLGNTESVKQSVDIKIRGVDLQAGGHIILKDINLDISAGEHVAIVGLSGAGKSSLVGLLLGWHRPSRGEILVDDEPLDGRRVQELRRETAWVDPAVQLWNRSLYDNLRYGSEYVEQLDFGQAIQKADLYGILERLPDGLKTILGESGGLISGGEGQRVRLGRAFLHPGARLVILDEPFRGLDRERRRQLLVQARNYWRGVTFFCVTHDVGETQSFPRVIVIENGQIVEDGAPSQLASQEGSRYRTFLLAEKDVRSSFWEGKEWRRLWIEAGRLRSGQNVDQLNVPDTSGIDENNVDTE